MIQSIQQTYLVHHIVEGACKLLFVHDLDRDLLLLIVQVEGSKDFAECATSDYFSRFIDLVVSLQFLRSLLLSSHACFD